MCWESFPGVSCTESCSPRRGGRMLPPDPKSGAQCSWQWRNILPGAWVILAKEKWPVEQRERPSLCGKLSLLSRAGPRCVNLGTRYASQKRCWPVATLKVVTVKVHLQKEMKCWYILCVWTWKNLINFMQSKRSKTQKNTYYMVHLI